MGFWDRLRRRTPEQAFTAEVAALVRGTPGVEGVEPGDDELSLQVVGSGPFGGGVMSLTNLFLEVQGLSDGDRRAAIVRFVEVVTRPNDVPDDWDQVRPRLLPAVRAAGFLGGRGGDKRPVSWWVAPFLVELVAVDFDGVMAFANREDLATWGVDAETVRAAAHHNLTTGGISVIAADDLPGGWWIVGPDSYESSWCDPVRSLADGPGRGGRPPPPRNPAGASPAGASPAGRRTRRSPACAPTRSSPDPRPIQPAGGSEIVHRPAVRTAAPRRGAARRRTASDPSSSGTAVNVSGGGGVDKGMLRRHAGTAGRRRMWRARWAVVGGVAAVLGAAALAAGPAAAGAQAGPTVSAGGPYNAVAGQALGLAGEISGFPGDVEVAWTLDDAGAPCELAGADLLNAAITCSEPTDAGLTLAVTDLTTGDVVGESTTIHVEAPSTLVVDAGGPYNGVVGEPIALHGTVTGAQGDIRVIWSEDAEEIPCTFGNAHSLDATLTCDEPFQVGIVLSVEDLRTGEIFPDVALIHVDEAPGGPTTSPPTSPTTGEPSPSPATTAPQTGTPSPAPGAGVDRLAETGAASGELVVAGGALLAAGSAALLGARRRRRTHGAGEAATP